MSGTDAATVATRCLDAWTAGDFATTRALLADDVVFVGPLATVEGGDAYVEGVKGLAQIVKGVDVHKVFVDGDDVCVIYDLVTTTAADPVPTVGWYQVRAGKIASVRVFFDPRPFLN